MQSSISAAPPAPPTIKAMITTLIGYTIKQQTALTTDQKTEIYAYLVANATIKQTQSIMSQLSIYIKGTAPIPSKSNQYPLLQKYLNTIVYKSVFSVSGKLILFKSFSSISPKKGIKVTVKKDLKNPSQIKLAETPGKAVNIQASDVVKSFTSNTQMISAVGSLHLEITDFMVDTSTKEYSVGIKIEDVNELIDGLGLGFLDGLIEFDEVDLYLSKIKNKKITPPPAAS